MILVTGATGFIGSHTCVRLIETGHKVVAIDNLCNSKRQVVNKINTITGTKLNFIKCEMCDIKELNEVFEKHEIDSVVHFAGLKAVGESVGRPLAYYENNLYSTINLLNIMNGKNIKKLVFSSSATVYGEPVTLPITEDFPLSSTNPYGATKLMIEQILKDVYKSDTDWNIALLRYFNPIGAHESGLIGEDPIGIPNNLLPYIINVALGKIKKLRIFGNDFPTLDGTGVRDYIHVTDLAEGHISALNKISKDSGLHIYNLGTGKGCSVLQLIKTFEEVNNVHIPYEIVKRRWGDVATCYADITKAEKELGWKAQRSIEQMCIDAWRFAKRMNGIDGK